MEVINVLPTPVAIIPCPFHAKVKETVLQEIEEKGFSDLSYNTGSENLRHIGHYSVLHDDAKFGRFRIGVNNRQSYMPRKSREITYRRQFKLQTVG